MAKTKEKKELSPEELAKVKAAKMEETRLKKNAMMEAEQKAVAEKYHQEVRENNIRDFVLNETIKTFDAMRHSYLKLQCKLLSQDKWDDYVNCVNLPSGSDPPDLRAFLQAWQNELKQYFKSSISWYIDVNERSLLSQDESSKNMSFKKLWKDQPFIGDQFIRRLRNANRLIYEMEKVISTTHLPFLKSELTEIREKYRKQMKSTADLFAYRLLTNIERDMIKIDVHHAEHNYATELFRSAVWTSRPVPQIGKIWLLETSVEDNKKFINSINFPLFPACLICPDLMETDGYAFRSLWTNYDHYSDTAPSFNLKVEELHVHDLRSANKADWIKMQELREAKLNEMIRIRTEWEEVEKKRIADEDAAARPKRGEADKIKKPKKKVRLGPEPPPANKDTIVAIDTEFQEYDDEQYTNFLEITSPNFLNLTENEVNLRSFHMLGGIIEFNYVKRPLQLNQIKEATMLRLDDGTILEYVDFNPVYENDPSYYNELIEINVKLSDKVSWWTTPIVAFWEPWEKSDEFLSLSPELQNFHLNYDQYVDKICSRLFRQPSIKINDSLIKSVNDFKVGAFPRDIGFEEFIKFYLIPRIPLSYKFQSEIDQEREILRKENLRRKEIEMEYQEEKDRQRRAFDEDMRLYKEQADAERNAMLDEKRREMEEERERTRSKLLNQGENDKQIEKHLKFKEQTDEKILQNIMMDEIIKVNEYYSQQYDLRFNVDARSQDSVIVHATPAAKSLPADLYPTYAKQLPLRVRMSEHKSICFDCPTIEDNEQIEVNEATDADQILLSTFLQYLNILYKKSLPNFEKHKLIGHREAIDESVTIVASTEDMEQASSLIPKKRKLSSVRGSTKAKQLKSKGKKGATKKGTDLDQNSSDLKQKSDSDTISAFATSQEKIIRQKAPPMQLIPHAAGKWMTTGIYFTEFDPTTNYIKYKTSQLGPFGFAMPKYCNYPLQYWEVYPNLAKKNCVVLKFIGNFCEVKLEINEDGYTIERIKPNKINFEPPKLPMSYEELRIFFEVSGIIKFPHDDAHHYITGVTEKLCVLEWHTLNCMAQYTLSYYFKQSKFNMGVGRRSAIFDSCQLHEETVVLELAKLEFEEILVSMLRANTVKSVEIPIKNSLETVLEHKLVPEDQEFFPDLLPLLSSRSHEISLKKHAQMKETFRYNVARLLCALRPLSFTI